jgi:hypothetical protein
LLTTQLDGLAEGAPDATWMEAGDDRRAESAPDATWMEAGDDRRAEGAPDAAGMDGGGDVHEASQGDASWCDLQAPTPTFCQDFDRGQPLAFGWSSSELTADAGLLRDPLALSTPWSLRAYAASGYNGVAVLRKTLDGSAIDLTFSIRTGDQTGDAGFVGNEKILAYIRTIDAQGGECWFLMSVDPSGLGQGKARFQSYLPDASGGELPYQGLSRFPQLGQWARMVLSFDTRATPPRVSIMMDNQSALGPTPFPECKVATTIETTIGLFLVDEGEARYDNIMINVR